MRPDQRYDHLGAARQVDQTARLTVGKTAPQLKNLGFSRRDHASNLLSVQKALRPIGAPVHLERENYPWDTPR